MNEQQRATNTEATGNVLTRATQWISNRFAKAHVDTGDRASGSPKAEHLSSVERPAMYGGNPAWPAGASALERRVAWDIERSSGYMAELPNHSLTREDARTEVNEAVAFMSQAKDPGLRLVVAVAMGNNAQNQEQYRDELQRIAPKLAREVQSTFASDSLRDAAEGARKLAVYMAEEPSHRARDASPAGPGSGERNDLWAVERRADTIADRPMHSLSIDEARALVREDLAFMASAKDPGPRYFAAVAMGDSARSQDHYRAELQRQSPSVAKEVQAASTENDRRLGDKEASKLVEFAAMTVGASGQQVAPTSPRLER